MACLWATFLWKLVYYGSCIVSAWVWESDYVGGLQLELSVCTSSNFIEQLLNTHSCIQGNLIRNPVPADCSRLCVQIV